MHLGLHSSVAGSSKLYVASSRTNMSLLDYFKAKPKGTVELVESTNVTSIESEEISKQLKQDHRKRRTIVKKEESTEFGSQQSERRLESML